MPVEELRKWEREEKATCKGHVVKQSATVGNQSLLSSGNSETQHESHGSELSHFRDEKDGFISMLSIMFRDVSRIC